MISDKKDKKIVLLAILLLVSLGFNLYNLKNNDSSNEEKSKVSNEVSSKGNNNLDEMLKHDISSNLQSFASMNGNIDDETAFASQVSSIVSAHNAYCYLYNGKDAALNERDLGLPALCIKIEEVIYNDKEKFKNVFQKPEVSELMYKIAENYEDKENISKVLKLLQN